MDSHLAFTRALIDKLQAKGKTKLAARGAESVKRFNESDGVASCIAAYELGTWSHAAMCQLLELGDADVVGMWQRTFAEAQEGRSH